MSGLRAERPFGNSASTHSEAMPPYTRASTLNQVGRMGSLARRAALVAPVVPAVTRGQPLKTRRTSRRPDVRASTSAWVE